MKAPWVIQCAARPEKYFTQGYSLKKKKKKKEKESKFYFMRYFRIVGKNRLLCSSDLSFDIDFAILRDQVI